MLFHKRDRHAGQDRQERGLYPILHMAGSLKAYQQELVRKEVASLAELGKVEAAFSGVLQEGDQFQVKLQELSEYFAGIGQEPEHFGQIRAEIGQAVSGAREQMENLGQTSAQVQQSYDSMAETFAQLEEAIRAQGGDPTTAQVERQVHTVNVPDPPAPEAARKKKAGWLKKLFGGK